MLRQLEQMYENYSSSKLIELSNLILNNLDDFVANWHPLGFVIIKLLKTTKYEYRLHIWPEHQRNPKKPNWPIHNHIFHLESLVLKGCIGSEEILVSRNMNSLNSYELYSVRYNQYGSDIIDSGKNISIKTKGISWAKSGEKYSIEKGVFHQSCVPPNKFAASLVRTTGQLKGESPLVVGEVNMKKIYPCPSLLVQNRELKQLLYKLKC